MAALPTEQQGGTGLIPFLSSILGQGNAPSGPPDPLANTPGYQDPSKAFRQGRIADMRNNVWGGSVKRSGGGIAAKQQAITSNRALGGDVRAQQKHELAMKQYKQTQDAKAKMYAMHVQESAESGQTLNQDVFMQMPVEQMMRHAGISNPQEAQLLSDLKSNGYFTGNQAAWDALEEEDQSRIVQLMYGQKGGTGKDILTREEFLEEINPKDWSPESYKTALETGDYGELLPRTNFNGVPEDVMKAEIASRKEYQKQVAPIKSLQRNHAKLITALNRGTGAGDMSAIFQYMKVLDPQSTVREGEFQLAAQIGGIQENWLNTYDKWTKGEILPEVARAELAALSHEMIMLTKGERDAMRADFSNRAQDYGLTESRITGDPALIYSYDPEKMPKYVPQQAPKKDTTVGQDIDAAVDAAKTFLGGDNS